MTDFAILAHSHPKPTIQTQPSPLALLVSTFKMCWTQTTSFTWLIRAPLFWCDSKKRIIAIPTLILPFHYIFLEVSPILNSGILIQGFFKFVRPVVQNFEIIASFSFKFWFLFHIISLLHHFFLFLRFPLSFYWQNMGIDFYPFIGFFCECPILVNNFGELNSQFNLSLLKINYEILLCNQFEISFKISIQVINPMRFLLSLGRVQHWQKPNDHLVFIQLGDLFLPENRCKELNSEIDLLPCSFHLSIIRINALNISQIFLHH